MNIVIGNQSDGFTIVVEGKHYNISDDRDEDDMNNLKAAIENILLDEVDVKVEEWY